MKNLKDEYANLINALSEDNFKLFVKNYLMDYWKTEEVNISDGPWDGGIDAVIVKNGKEIKRNIQITVQDNYESKLFKDVEKSKRNVDEFSYQNKLDFFISKPISKIKKNTLSQTSEVDYDIILTLYDSGKLGEDTNTFDRAKYFLQELYANNTINISLNIDKRSKVFFDILSMGGKVADIKYDYINSHLQLFLFDNGSSTIDEIISNVNNSLNSCIHEKAFLSQISKQIKQGMIEEVDLKYDLTEEAKSKISEIQLLSRSHENLLIDNVSKCLEKYRMELLTNEIITHIYILYNAHYETEIDEINSKADSFEPKERKVYIELVKFVKSKGVQKQSANQLVKDILDVCATSEYLNKISISNLFTSLFKSNKIEKYLDKFNRNIFLDTQILLQLICFEYKDTDYNDSLYNSVKFLCQQKEQMKGKVKFHTTSDYVEEVAGHLWEANKIKRLLELPFIEALGSSKNVFFNFYNHLKSKTDEVLEDFNEFIERLFDIELDAINKFDFIKDVYSDIFDCLENIGIEIHEVPYYDKFTTYKKDYEIELSYSGNDHKSKTARDNDLKCLLFLSSQDYHVNAESGLFDEPFFITWDSSFYNMRKFFTNKYKDFSYWYIYTPLKFANRLSVMNLNLNTSCLNYDIISLAETNFNLSNESVSFIDTLSLFFNKGNINNWQLGQKLAKLKKKQKEDSSLEDFSEKFHKNQPVDEVLRAIQNHFNKPLISTSFQSVIEVFENDTYSDMLASLILENCKYLVTNKKINDSLFNEIDELIKAS